MKKHFLRLLTLIAAITFMGCQIVLPEYTVTYSTEHGTAPYAIKLVQNTALTEQHLPELNADGYTFNGWLNSANNKKVTVGYKIFDDLNLKASWTKVESPAEPEVNAPEQTPDNNNPENKNPDDKNPETPDNTNPR